MFAPGKLSSASQYRYEYVLLKGRQAFTAGTSNPGNQPLVTIAHNLGYVPFYRLFYTYGDGNIFELFAGNSSYNIDGNGMQVNNVYADTANLYVQFFNASTTTPYSGTVYYRIYGEPK